MTVKLKILIGIFAKNNPKIKFILKKTKKYKKRIDFIPITVYNIKVHIIVGVVCPKMIFGWFAMLQ